MNKVTVILNVYKRPETLEKQIESIKNQSIGLKNIDIHVWYNYSGIIQPLPKDNTIKIYQSNWNSKFWGRFLIPMLSKNKYVAIFDDDILPGNKWFENCIKSMDIQEGIYGGSGVILNRKGYTGSRKIGWNALHSDKIEQVDLVGHAWFFKQKWGKYLWYENPVSWNNGEDIMFSYLAQKHGGINTFVPPHPESDKMLWSSDFNFGATFGSDKNASYKKGEHYGDRDKICVECINSGWKTVNKIK